ncbi:hypothetical protein UPYG_G00258130 [Umbra pygmaea]|uniref:Protein SPT2 homolog n=1 Tax=Umbra pygmaea TaxID=75934 RepID=A0ABD0W8R2_UMBPY
MDFENVLSIASQNQGLSTVPKRYSLQTGPPKKDPKVKGVNSAAVQAFLKKKEMENKKRALLTMKKKEHLLAKRVELKSDRKARAMASRTKDNFRGYNGVPVVDEPKKKRLRCERSEDQQRGEEHHQSNTYEEDYEDKYEYTQTDSDPEPDPEPQNPRQPAPNSSFQLSKRPGGQHKPAPPTMNFAELLKLAQKKQFEPVEVKAKSSKKSEPDRLRTAEEIRELELEHKAKRLDKGSKDYRPPERDRERDQKSQTSISCSRKSMSNRDVNNGKPPHKSSSERLIPDGSRNKSKLALPHSKLIERSQHVSAKLFQGSEQDRDRPKVKPSLNYTSSSSGALSSKAPTKGVSFQISAKHPTQRTSSSGQHPINTSEFNNPRRGNLSLPPRPGSSGARPTIAKSSTQTQPQGSGQNRPQQGGPSGQARPSYGSSRRPGPPTGQTGGNYVMKLGSNGQISPTTGNPRGLPQNRPSGSVHGRPVEGPVRSIGNALGQPNIGIGSVPGRSKCSVVAETISSKTFGGARGAPQNPGMPPRPGMPPSRPGMPPRHGMHPRPMMRPPGTTLPPITSAYKRKYEEEEEYDSEMEDFIDDEGEPQDEISKHIREIFGYDRTKYKEESDYALKFMESSWRDQQKEEARSLRLGIKEDEDEMRLEEEEMKRKMAMNAKRKKV